MKPLFLGNSMFSVFGLFENEWNDFDKLTSQTRMLHTTRRKTRPWKAGLPIDWRPAERFRLFPPVAWLMRARRHQFGAYALLLILVLAAWPALATWLPDLVYK